MADSTLSIQQPHKSGYNSDNDDGDSLFSEQFDAGPTSQSAVDLPENSQPYVTQPTQPLNTPPHKRIRADPASPVVQVAASSPLPHNLTTRPSPVNVDHVRPAKNGTPLANIMAPPGTQFRPPGLRDSSAPPQSQTQTQTQTQTMDNISDSSDDEQRRQDNDIKPSVFSKGANASSPSQSRFAQFSYNGSETRPPKRTADPLSDGYANATRPTKVARQSQPARAQPAAPDISIDDIEDFSVRKKVINMRIVFASKFSVTQCVQALMKCRGDQMAAQSDLVENEERMASQAQQSQSTIDLTASDLDEALPTKFNKPTAKRDINNKRSINQKWFSTQAAARQAPGSTASRIADTIASSSATKQNPQLASQSIADRYSKKPPLSNEEPAPKRKKLARPRQTSPSPSDSSPSPQAVEKPQNRPTHVVESDGDEHDSGVGSGDEAAHGGSNGLLEFINTCSTAELLDLSNQPQDIVDHMISQRPFTSLDHASGVTLDTTGTTRNGKPRKSVKKVGERIIEASSQMWDGYNAVDQLVSKCEELGRPLAAKMRELGFDAYGTKGELEMVDIEANHDSGIGTPSSSAAPEEDSKKSRNPRLLQQPRTMSSDLVMKDYQIAGLNWLALLYEADLSGLLSDDMGLGKTCQVLAFLTHLKEKGVKGTHLVVVPGSTLENWLREFSMFSPNLRVEPYYGGQNERVEIQAHLESEMKDIDVIVTTYDMAVKAGDSKFLRKRVSPVVCVYDEGHALKNRYSSRYKALLSLPAKFRLILTGTPVQNNLQELVSLLAFLLPSVFSEHEEDLGYIFKQKAKLSGTSGADGKGTLLSSERISRARSMMTPFILRRKKHQVLKQLPKKTNRVEYCDLSQPQRAIYDEIAARAFSILGDDKSSAGSKTNSLMDLRKAAIHPLLFRRHFDDNLLRKIAKVHCQLHADANEQYVFEDLQQMTDFELHRMCTDAERDSARTKKLIKYALDKQGKEGCNDNGVEEWMNSAKVRTLIRILKDFEANGHRTLVFSQFQMVLDILELALTSSDLPFYRLDGSTPIATRQDLIDSFKTDTATSVFMLSTRAGGQGLNLTAADRVVIFDAGFNPHEDVQAENRAHRVGQDKEVEVIRLIARGTVEEQILQLGENKLALDERVAGSSEGIDSQQGDEREVEKKGMNIVEDLLKNPRSTAAERRDVAEQFKNGLKEAGLNVAR